MISLYLTYYIQVELLQTKKNQWIHGNMWVLENWLSKPFSAKVDSISGRNKEMDIYIQSLL